MPHWIEDLPAELADTISDEDKANPLLVKYENFGEYIKGTIEAQSRLGNSLRIPGPEAPESDKNAFYQKIIDMGAPVMPKPDFSQEDQAETFYRSIGKPEEQDKYDVPEGVNLPPEVIDEMRTIGFQANMTKAQFKKWTEELNTRNAATLESQQGEFSTQINELKGKWGMAFDERSAAASKINSELNLYPGKDAANLTATEIEALYNVHASLTGKGPQVATQEPNQSPRLTVGEVEARANEWHRKIMLNEENRSPSENNKEMQKYLAWLQENHPKYQQSA